MRVIFRFERLKEARIQKNLTQEELAERCNSSDRYIRDLETGKKAHPSAKILYLISSILEIPMEALLDTEQEETE